VETASRILHQYTLIKPFKWCCVWWLWSWWKGHMSTSLNRNPLVTRLQILIHRFTLMKPLNMVTSCLVMSTY